MRRSARTDLCGGDQRWSSLPRHLDTSVWYAKHKFAVVFVNAWDPYARSRSNLHVGPVYVMYNNVVRLLPSHS